MKKPTLLALALIGAPAAAAEPPPATPELLAKGKQSFDQVCAVCHGVTGKGDGLGAAALNPKPRDFTKDPFKNGTAPENIFKTLQTGVPGTPMVPYAHLPEADRWALAHYVASLVPGKAAAKPDAKPDAKATQKTTAGKKP